MPVANRYQVEIATRPTPEDIDNGNEPYWDVAYWENRSQQFPTWRQAEGALGLFRRSPSFETYLLRITDMQTYIEQAVCPENELQKIDPTAEKKNMVNVKYTKKNGKLFLVVNAQGLHETLDAIGVQSDGSPAKYRDRPYTTTAVCDPTALLLSTDVFLVKEYPVEADLTKIFVSPPSIENLKKMAQTAYEQVRRILEHYQPIDIQVEIQKKVLKES